MCEWQKSVQGLTIAGLIQSTSSVLPSKAENTYVNLNKN